MWAWRLDKTWRSARGLIVCRETERGRQYRLFDYDEFEKHYESAQAPKAYYEVIVGARAHRFYMDLDLPGATQELADAVLEEVVSAARAVLALSDLARELLVFSSHGTHKKSFHLLFQRRVDSNEAAQDVYERILARVREPWKNYADKLYKSLQQFRMLGSQKLNDAEARVKTHAREWSFAGQRVQCAALTRVREALASWIPENTPSVECTPRPRKNIKVAQEWEEERLKCLQELGDFEVRARDAQYVYLNTRRPYTCPLCARVHERENPYLIVTPLRVYFHCRRARTKKYYVLEGPNKGSALPHPSARELQLQEWLKRLGQGESAREREPSTELWRK